MGKMKIAVMMGGVSSERDISLRPGEMVAGKLDRQTYEPVSVVYTM